MEESRGNKSSIQMQVFTLTIKLKINNNTVVHRICAPKVSSQLKLLKPLYQNLVIILFEEFKRLHRKWRYISKPSSFGV